MNYEELIENIKERKDWRTYLCDRIHSINQIKKMYSSHKNDVSNLQFLITVDHTRAIVDYALYNFIAKCSELITSENKDKFYKLISEFILTDNSAVGMKNKDDKFIDNVRIFS